MYQLTVRRFRWTQGLKKGEISEELALAMNREFYRQENLFVDNHQGGDAGIINVRTGKPVSQRDLSFLVNFLVEIGETPWTELGQTGTV